MDDERARLGVYLAAAVAAGVALGGAVVLVVLRVANDGPETPGRNWWLIADVALAFGYLPAAAVLISRPGRRLLGTAFLVVGATQLLSAVIAQWSAYRGDIGEGAGHPVADVLETVGLLVLVAVVPWLLPWRARGRGDPLRWWFAFGMVAAVVGAIPGIIPVGNFPGADVFAPLLLLATVPLLVLPAILATEREAPFELASHRFLSWVVLAAGVVVIYTAMVAGFGQAVGAHGPAWLLIATTGGIALVLEPARRFVRRMIDRAVYGERDDPLALVRQLTQSVTTTVDVDTLLPSLATTLGRSMRFDFVAIDLPGDRGWTRAATFGQQAAHQETCPLHSGDEEIGRLVVGWADSTGLRSRDRATLADVLPQVWLAVTLVRLTNDLRRSSVAVLATREDERRRLRRDLHDGLGPTLTGTSMAQRALLRRMQRDGATPEHLEVGEQLAVAIDGAADDVKRIVRDLRPAVLDDRGLAAALADFVGRLDGSLRVDCELPRVEPALPAIVEVAAYRIATEAMTNVVRHAHASGLRLVLAVGEEVVIDVVDDGIGIGENRRAGVGLTSMRERVSALGGTLAISAADPHGTRVHVTLPVEVS